MITIIKRKYISTDASVIRTMALAKSLGEQDVEVRIMFLLPTPSKENLPPNMLNVKYVYLSNGTNNYINICNGLLNMLIKLKKGEIVILASFMFPVFIFLCGIAFLIKIHLYHERTEYPPYFFKGRLGVRIKEYIYMRLVRKTEGVFVISQKLKEYFLRNGVKEKMIHVINMVVDSDRFKNLKKIQSQRYVAYCGTVTNFKDGVDVLLEAFALVAKNVDDINLYILGNTPYEKDRKQNMQIVQKNNLVDRVYMPGSVSADILPQYLKNAEILALARPDNVQAAYGFPTKLGEYLLTGNPVVVTRVGELDNFLVDRESCLFANPNSAEDFADKLLWLLAHPDEGKQIGKKGKRVAELNFNSRIEAQKIIRVLNTLK